MRAQTAFVCFTVLPFFLSAQYKVRISITALPDTPAAKNIYVAGSFNNWDPAYALAKIKRDTDGNLFVDLENISAGIHEFKFTRGNWETVETNADRSDIKNRRLSVQSDTVLNCVIAGWKTVSVMKENLHTASKNVQIIDSAFYMPELNRRRRIWLYLPEDYAISTKRYQVMYMHDGQNLFDAATSYSGEWGVDETMDNMKNPCIVVGIDNGSGKRMNEYNPNDTEQYGKGEGMEYLEFIAKTLKPYIDKNYRTLRSKKNTIMAGSSMGGLITFYAGLYYPHVFGKLGVFSPAFWVAPKVATEIIRIVKPRTHSAQKYYFYGGGSETRTLVTDMLQIYDLMRAKSRATLEMVIKPEGQHNEYTWGKEFPGFYQWIIK